MHRLKLKHCVYQMCVPALTENWRDVLSGSDDEWEVCNSGSGVCMRDADDVTTTCQPCGYVSVPGGTDIPCCPGV